MSRPFPDRRGLALLFLALLAVYLIEILHGLPNRDIVWGYDANPLIPLIAAKKIFLEGWNAGWHSAYPNFHYYVLLLFLGPYMAAQWLLGNLSGLQMGGGYPYGLKDFDTIFMHLALITRLVSVAMALGTAYLVYRIGQALHSNRAGVFAACIIGFSPAVVYYVHVETLDVPMLFWLSAALYCYVRVLQTFELRFYIWLAVLAAVSTATKDYAYGAFVLLPLPLAAALARHAYGSNSPAALARAAFDRRHLIALAAFVAAFAIAENWVWNFNGFVNHVRLAGGFVPPPSGGVITTSFGRLDLFSLQRLGSGLRIMTFVLGWAGIAVCIGGLVYAGLRKRKIAGILLWPAASYYVFAVVPTLPAGSLIERPYMPLGVMLAIIGGVLLARVSQSPRVLSKVVWIGAVAAMALNAVAMDAALITDPRYQAERWLGQHVAAGAKLEFYGLRSELPRADPQWNSAILNVASTPLNDMKLSEEYLAQEALADRNPDWIVVSEAYLRSYSADQGKGVDHALHAFFQKLRNGELKYAQVARFVSTVSDALGFPARLAPPVTVFSR